MSLRKTIDGTSLTGGWAAIAGTLVTAANSGAAAGNRFATGLLSSGGGLDWTYRALSAADLIDPVIVDGVAGNGYIESTAGAQCYFAAEAAGTACPSTGDDYWIEVVARIATTGAAMPGDASASMNGAVTSGNSLVWSWIQNNGTAPTAQGFSFFISAGGTVGGSASPIFAANGVTAPCMMFNEWYNIAIHWHRAATASGYAELYINQRKVCVFSGSELDSAAVINWAAQSLLFLSPAWSGTKLQIASIKAHDAMTISRVPMHALDSAQPLTKCFMPVFANADTNPSQGLDWQWTGATMTVHTEYQNATGSERRRIFKCTAGSTAVASTTQNIGTLPYAAQGWGHLCWPDMYVPGGSVIVSLKNSANAANLMTFTVVNTGGSSGTFDIYTTDPSGNAVYIFRSIPAAARYSWFLHFNSDGRATSTLIDRSTSLGAAARGAYSAPMPDWTPAVFGKATLAFTFDTTAIEIGGLFVSARPVIAMLDSLSSITNTLVTPNIRVPYVVAAGWPTLEERQCLPRGYWNHKEVGLNRRNIMSVCGQQGLTRAGWSQNMQQCFSYTHGCEFLVIDGGCANDVNASVITPTGDNTNTINALKRSYTQMFADLIRNDNAIFITTAFARSRQATVTAIADNGSGKCRITAAAYGLASDGDNPRITGGTGIAGIDSSTGLTIVGSSRTTNTFDVTINYSAPTLVAPVVVPLSSQREAVRQALNTHIRLLVQQYQLNGLVTFADIDQDQTDNPLTYPNTIGTGNLWSDVVHPQTWQPGTALTVGSWVFAKRMAVLSQINQPIAPASRRRTPHVLSL